MSTIHRKGFEHATSRPTQSPHPHGSPKGLRRSRCKVIEHDSSSGVVAFQPFIRRAFDEHSPVSSSSTRAPGRNLPLILLIVANALQPGGASLSSSSSYSSSFLPRPSPTLSPSNFGQPATGRHCFAGQKGPLPKGIPSNL